MTKQEFKVELVVNRLNIALGHGGMDRVNAREAKMAWDELPEHKRKQFLPVMSDRERLLVGLTAKE